MTLAWLQQWAPALAGRCAVCGAWPAQPVCRGCIAQFTRTQARCRRCALPLPAGVATCGACVLEPPPLDACFAAVAYAYPWSGLLARFKFDGEPGWARTLAQRMAIVEGVAGEIEAADVVLPMPLAAQRLAQRGYNQALLLARCLAGRKVQARLLLRLRETGPQTALDRATRQRNVRDAFGVDPLRVHEVRGRRVLLVDDVMTSGASLHAAARAVRQAGAAWVAALVLARTDQPAA